MANEKLARRYAEAVFSLAAEGDAVERIGRDLREIALGIGSDAEVERFFQAPVVAREDKARVVRGAFEGRVNLVALHTVLLLVRKRRESLLGEVVGEYEKLERRARGREPLTISTATQLGDEELRALVGHLERLYGKRFEVTQRVDPALIGGVRVTMGDRRFDGSVAGRLDELSRALFSAN